VSCGANYVLYVLAKFFAFTQVGRVSKPSVGGQYNSYATFDFLSAQKQPFFLRWYMFD
jgi:hypothetical protein